MTISKRAAREIRRGIVTARQVMRRERVAPQLTPFGFNGAPVMPLWERAYHHEFLAAALDGRIRPPKGPGGVSQPRRKAPDLGTTEPKVKD